MACLAKGTALARIPDHVSVAADDTLAAYLVDRDYVHELKPGLLDTTGRSLYPTYVAIDGRGEFNPVTDKNLVGWRAQLEPERTGSAYEVLDAYFFIDPGDGANHDVMILTTPYPSSPR